MIVPLNIRGYTSNSRDLRPGKIPLADCVSGGAGFAWLPIHTYPSSPVSCRSLRRVAVACLGGCLLAVSSLSAQVEFPAASQPASFKQRVGITHFEVSYARPSMRERVIFGDLVPYGEVWRAGANAATKVTVSTAFTFGTTPVAAGTYALFAIPGESEWTVILNENDEQWGSYNHDAAKDVARAVVPVQRQSPATETFTIEVNDITVDSATLQLAWADVRVAVPLAVDTMALVTPGLEEIMASDAEKKPYAQAAMFYLEAGGDLAQAAEWMAQAVAAQPNAFWLSYRQALIFEARGDLAAARTAAEASLAAAEKGSAAVNAEYIRLNQVLLARLKS